MIRGYPKDWGVLSDVQGLSKMEINIFQVLIYVILREISETRFYLVSVLIIAEQCVFSMTAKLILGEIFKVSDKKSKHTENT